MTVFDHHGQYVRVLHVPGDPIQISCDTAGHLAILSITANSRITDSVVTGAVFLATSAGDSLYALDSVRLGSTRPLEPITSLALADDRLYVGTAESTLVAAFSNTGAVLSPLFVDVSRTRATQQNYDATIEEIVSVLPEAAARHASEKFLRTNPMPEYAPIYRRILPGPDSSLWVVTTPRGSTPTLVTAKRPDGSPLARLVLPFDGDVYEVGSGYILAGYSDSVDAQHVVEYRLTFDH